ncbi:MAG: hypothetical protein ACRCWO_04510, partial [Bosea sp. (in: a-proteobacteria)]
MARITALAAALVILSGMAHAQTSIVPGQTPPSGAGTGTVEAQPLSPPPGVAPVVPAPDQKLAEPTPPAATAPPVTSPAAPPATATPAPAAPATAAQPADPNATLAGKPGDIGN